MFVEWLIKSIIDNLNAIKRVLQPISTSSSVSYTFLKRDFLFLFVIKSKFEHFGFESKLFCSSLIEKIKSEEEEADRKRKEEGGACEQVKKVLKTKKKK